MDPRTEHHRQDIDAGRQSMTDKLEQAEAKLRNTVEGTKDTVRDWVDIRSQVAAHPWMAFGGAVLAGYLLGSMGGRSEPEPRPGMPMRYYPLDADRERPRTSRNGGQSTPPRMAPRRTSPGFMDQLRSQFGDEFELLKGAALTSIMGLVQDTMRDNLPRMHEEYERLRHERDRAVQRVQIDDRSRPVTAASSPPAQPSPAQRRADASVNTEAIPPSSAQQTEGL